MTPRLPLLLLLLSLSAPLPAARAALPQPLVLNGVGLRTRPLIGTLYEMALHLPADMLGAHPKAIIEDGRPMELTMTIKSSMVTRPRLVEATTEGFEKAAKSGYPTTQSAEFLRQFDDREFRKGDVIRMRFENGGIVTYYLAANSKEPPPGQRIGRIAGREFKQALFAIWLGDQPVQDSLRQGLLQGRP